MSNREEILTPVGRLVQGSLYDPQTTDAENKPLLYKTGAKAGEPRTQFYFALAIAKGAEKHWAETEWGAKIWAVGHAGFPGGQAQSPTFAWKIKDGDSTVPNKVGRKPCDIEGFPGHWVLSFSGGFAPSIHNEDGTRQILEPNFVKAGDYIQVYGAVSDNSSTVQPGIYLNHQLVAFRAHGERIMVGADPKAVGFGKDPLPSGAKDVPPPSGFNPMTPPPIAPSQPPIIPHTQILNPPPPITSTVPFAHPVTPPARVMLPAAQGASYEQMLAAGWTDALLIQHGMMKP